MRVRAAGVAEVAEVAEEAEAAGVEAEVAGVEAEVAGVEAEEAEEAISSGPGSGGPSVAQPMRSSDRRKSPQRRPRPEVLFEPMVMRDEDGL